MAWNTITLSDGSTRWVDEQTAQAWLDYLLPLVQRDGTYLSSLVQSEDNKVQHDAVFRAWNILGTVYQCLNLPPQTDASYLDEFVKAYGVSKDEFSRSNLETLCLSARVTSQSGWIVRGSAESAYGSTADAEYARQHPIDYVARVWLKNNAQTRVSCFNNPYDRTCVNGEGDPWYQISGRAQLRGINIDRADCRDAYDWRCVQWFGRTVVFPAVIWSMYLAGAIAQSIQQRGLRATMEESVRFASSQQRPWLLYDGRPTVGIAAPGTEAEAISAPVGSPTTVTPVGQMPMTSPRVTPIGQMPMTSPHVTPIGQMPMTSPRVTPIGQMPMSPSQTPTGTPMATNTNSPTLTLADLNTSCDQWNAMDNNRKTLAVQSGFIEKYNIQIPIDSIMTVVASINATCPPTPTPTTPRPQQPGQGGTVRALPATLGDIFMELRTDCVTWLRYPTGAKAEMIRQMIFVPRNIQPSANDLQKLVGTLDACASATVNPPAAATTKPSWWDGNGPLLAGGAILGGLVWYSFREKKIEENFLDTGGLLEPVESSSSAPTFTDTTIESTTVSDGDNATFPEGFFG